MRKLLSKNSGVGLIEVLVSVLVISSGLLGLASIHLNGIKLVQSSALQFQANVLAADIVESMRANITTAETGIYDVASLGVITTGVTSCETNICSTTELVAWDLEQWRAAVEASLPAADATISSVFVAGVRTHTVTVKYINSKGDALDEVVIDVVL